jgi:putative ABC transport system permease protein
MQQDLRYALRALVRNPGLTAGAVLACALGVGSATAVFSVVDRILFRPLPYRDGARLVSVGITAPLDSSEFLLTQNYLALRRDAPPFSAVTAFQAGASTCDLTESGALRLRCLRVDADFLDVLGVAPRLGRAISIEENRPGQPPVALISHALWRSWYGSDPALPGKTMMLDGVPTRIVGVLPADFEMPTLTEADILLALQPDEARERPGGRFLRAFARLKPGITVEQASTQLQPYFQGVVETVPARFRKEVKLRVQSVRDRQTSAAKPASLALLGAVLAVLLIACANIANLLLARAATRDREMAVRAALGASRFRLARLALVESLLLATAGGMLGVALAKGLLKLVISIAPGVLPRLAAASLDGRVLLFALAITGAAGILTGLVPAWHRPSGVLGSSRGVAPGVSGLRAALVATQIAASMVLLTGAGLLLRSLWNLENVRLGLDPDRVVTARFTLGRARYQKPEDQVAFYNALERRLSAIPGVEAAITDSLPPSGNMRSSPLSTIAIEGRPPLPEGTGGMVAWRYVTDGYFNALSIPILRGRGFTQEDRGPHVYSVILSESLARRMFPVENPLGKHILKHGDVWFTVIGIAADVKNSGLGNETAPEYYRIRKPAADLTFFNAEPPTGWRAATVVARTNLNPQAVAAMLKDSVQAIDSTVPVETGTMRARLREVTAGSRFQSILLSVFGAIGILLAAVGSFGVTAFLVAQRRREMGIRLALGATTSNIQWLSVRRVASWTGLGLALGVAGSYAAARSLRALLFGVEPLDPVTLTLAALLLGTVACVAAWLPARRAAQVDPAEVLTPE